MVFPESLEDSLKDVAAVGGIAVQNPVVGVHLEPGFVIRGPGLGSP